MKNLVITLMVMVITLFGGASEVDVNSINYTTPEQMDGYSTYEVVDIDQSTADEGYIQIRLNKEVNTDDYKYIVMPYYETIGEIQAQFTLESKDWEICNLSDMNVDIYVFRVEKSEYTKSLTSLEAGTKITGLAENLVFGCKVELAEKINLDGPQKFDLTGGTSTDTWAYTQQTVWYQWDEKGLAASVAADLREQNESVKDFAEACVNWIYNFIQYNHEKAECKVENPYDRFDADEIIRTKSGVCSDMASLMVVMMRSQGIPATYISGTYTVDGVDEAHGWVQYYVEDGENSSWWSCDPTMGRTQLDNLYTETYNK